MGRQWAIRKGNWKLLQMDRGPQLFDLGQDIGERNDLASERPALVRELTTAWQTWNRDLVKPLWPGPDYVEQDK